MDPPARKPRLPADDMRLMARAGLAVGFGALAVVAIVVRRNAGASPPPDQQPAWTPLPKRVQIEVLNTGKVPGAARVGTQLLRHAGLDVVQSGNADSTLRGLERNRIAVRRGDTTGVGRIIEALGGAVVVDSPDRSRMVDLTVYLGRKFAPPPDRVSANQ